MYVYEFVVVICIIICNIIFQSFLQLKIYNKFLCLKINLRLYFSYKLQF